MKRKVSDYPALKCIEQIRSQIKHLFCSTESSNRQSRSETTITAKHRRLEVIF